MRLANEAAATAFRVLNKCSDELTPNGAWRWNCSVQNGTRLPIAASLENSFLHLECLPEGLRNDVCTFEQVLLGNRTLTGGVKLALDAASNGIHLSTDIVVQEEKHLFDRFHWALEGFHDGYWLLKSPTSYLGRAAAAAPSSSDLSELLHEVSWPTTERGPNDFSVELSANSAAQARIRITENGVVITSEMARLSAAAEPSRRALALFLLSATNALRFVRAFAERTDSGFVMGVQVGLPCVPAIEEIDHGLAALSIAHRMCAKEIGVLLNEATARCYLAARDHSITHDHQTEQEN